MSIQPLSGKKKTLSLERGLYLLRYDESVYQAAPPIVRITCEPGKSEVVLHPDARVALMSRPGMAVVLRAIDHANVEIEVSPSQPGGSIDATLKIEPLEHDRGAAVRQTNTRAPTIAARSAGMPVPATPIASEVLGHLSRVGDKVAAFDEWLGGPSNPARIEGFSINWSNADGTKLKYCATGAGEAIDRQPMLSAGEFAGSRGRARPLVRALFEMTGPNARHHEMTVEYLFLGQSPRLARGARIELRSPTGRDPLIGLRFGIKSGAADQPSDLLDQGRPVNTGDRRRVRVFKV